MALLNVLQFPHPRLRLKALPVEAVTADIKILLHNMRDTMYADRGIGLAATQVNIQQRLIVIDLSEKQDSPLYLINPEIQDLSGTEEMDEGCLSVPGIFEKVKRAEKIKVNYLDENGQPQTLSADGLLAVCIQHEIDHLNGKLFIDHLSPLKRQRIEKKLAKQERSRL